MILFLIALPVLAYPRALPCRRRNSKKRRRGGKTAAVAGDDGKYSKYHKKRGPEGAVMGTANTVYPPLESLEEDEASCQLGEY